MASGTCRGRKNKEENYLFANSNGEQRHCRVMNKSFYSVYMRHQLTFERNCSSGIPAPALDVSILPSSPSRLDAICCSLGKALALNLCQGRFFGMCQEIG